MAFPHPRAAFTFALPQRSHERRALMTAFERRCPCYNEGDGIRVPILDEQLGFGVKEGLKKSNMQSPSLT